MLSPPMLQGNAIVPPILESSLRAPRRKQISSSTGFTLVEVLVVLVIMGMIMSMVGPRVLGYLSDSKVKTARIQIENLTSAVDLFYLDNGRYPTQTEGLSVLTTKAADTPTWNGPYLKSNIVPIDPWGRPFNYRIPGTIGPYDISSLGPNGLGAEGSSAARIDAADK